MYADDNLLSERDESFVFWICITSTNYCV